MSLRRPSASSTSFKVNSNDDSIAQICKSMMPFLCESNRYKESYSKSKFFRVLCGFDHFGVQSGWSSLRAMCQSHRRRVHGSLDHRVSQEQRTVSSKAGLCPVMPMIKQDLVSGSGMNHALKHDYNETASDTTNCQ